MNLMDYLANNRQQPPQQQPVYGQYQQPMQYGQTHQPPQVNPLAALLGGQPQPAQVQQLMNLLTQMGAVPNPAYQPMSAGQGMPPAQGYYTPQQMSIPPQAPIMHQQQQQMPQSYTPQQFSSQQPDPRLQQQQPVRIHLTLAR